MKKAASQKELNRLAGNTKGYPVQFGQDAGAFMACDLTREEYNDLVKNGGITPGNKQYFYRPFGSKSLRTLPIK